MDATAVSTDLHLNATQEKMLKMLGEGYPAIVVAQAVGCSEAYVSQNLALDWFAQKVQELKYIKLQKSTAIDTKYDNLEEKLLDKLERAIPLIVRPHDITKTLQIINGAKRRGAGSNQSATLTQNIVQLTIPSALVHRFTSNTQNQIVEVQDGNGKQSPLITTTSGALEKLSREAREAKELPDCISGSYTTVGDASSGQGQTISSEALNLLSGPSSSPAGLKEVLASQGKIAAADL